MSEFRSDANASHNEMTVKSEQQTGFAISIPDSQLNDGRTIGSLRAYPAVIGLYTPVPFPFGSMPNSLCLMRIRPRASTSITV
jgi:hypothetical protein